MTSGALKIHSTLYQKSQEKQKKVTYYISSFSYIQNYHYAFVELRFSAAAATNIAINLEEFLRVCQCTRTLHTEPTSDCKLHFYCSSTANIDIFHCTFYYFAPRFVSAFEKRLQQEGVHYKTYKVRDETRVHEVTSTSKSDQGYSEWRGNLRTCTKSSEQQHSLFQLAWLANS